MRFIFSFFNFYKKQKVIRAQVVIFFITPDIPDVLH